MRSVYRDIKEATEEMDLSRLGDIIERMNGYRIPETESDRWKRIRTAYERFDYSDILELV